MGGYAVSQGLEGASTENPLTGEQGMRPLATVLILILTLSSAHTAVISSSDYRVGEAVQQDIIAPFDFAVVNAEQTERVRREELPKVPAIFRFDPWVAIQAEEKLTAAFAKLREAFSDAIEVAARKRRLDEATVAHPSFAKFVEWFSGRYPDAPLNTNLARIWALGESDDAVLLKLQIALREVMARYIRPDSLPDHGNTAELRIIRVESPREALTLDDARARGESVARTEVLTVSEVRGEITRRLRDDGASLAGFAASFIHENVVCDELLTNQKRQERAAELVVFDQYSPGQVLVRAGQILDAKSKAALDVLDAAMKRQQTRASVTPDQRTGWREHFRARLLAAWTDLTGIARQHPWLPPAVAILALLVLWRFARSRTCVAPLPTCEAYTVMMHPSRNETVFLPAVIEQPAVLPPATPLAGGPIASHANAQWQLQLREAEQRAEELLAMVRAGLAPHLARELTHKLVQELVYQRTTLLRAHQMAEQEIIALEVRFEKVQRELQERLKLHERRTIELEEELAAKTEQTRELMKATILLTQQKLEEKKAGDEFACN